MSTTTTDQTMTYMSSTKLLGEIIKLQSSKRLFILHHLICFHFDNSSHFPCISLMSQLHDVSFNGDLETNTFACQSLG